MRSKEEKISISPTNKDIQINLDEKDRVKHPYPKSVFLILIAEFCERFCYYGMRAVLTLYLRNKLGYSENDSTTLYHLYLFLCYATPLIGGIISDSWLGKYKTIVYISFIYIIGDLLLTLSAIPTFTNLALLLALAGLGLMGLGTGGIKPCVVALAGEQFECKKQLSQFFSMFMFIVSIASMTSTIVSPVFRRDISCFGDDTCYSLAFGFPASLMVLSLAAFICGSKWYKMSKPTQNITLSISKCILEGIKNRFKGEKRSKNEHWLDACKEKHGIEVVEDTKGFLRILVYYLPVPLYWALYEQIGSRWTLQASHMDGEIVNFYTIKPDQMQVANAVLMFTFIPLFETVLFPLARKCNFLKRPLQRMGTGGFLAGIAFIMAGVLEMQIEGSYPILPGGNGSQINLINGLNCPLKLNLEHLNLNLNNKMMKDMKDSGEVILGAENNIILSSITEGNVIFGIKVLGNTESCSFVDEGEVEEEKIGKMKSVETSFSSSDWERHRINIEAGSSSTFVVVLHNNKTFIKRFEGNDVNFMKKSKEGNAKLRVGVFLEKSNKKEKEDGIEEVFTGNENENGDNSSLSLSKDLIIKVIKEGGKHIQYLQAQLETTSSSHSNFSLNSSQSQSHSLSLLQLQPPSLLFLTTPTELEPDRYRIEVLLREKSLNESESRDSESEFEVVSTNGKWIDLKTGGSYIILLHPPEIKSQNQNFKTQIVILTNPNNVHMLWQLLQYILMAAAEVLFVIAGLEFSFTEAPKSIKSLMQSFWHLMNAVGNVFVILVAQSHLFAHQSTEFFTFAVLIFIDMAIFAWLASGYKYLDKPRKNKEEKGDYSLTKATPQPKPLSAEKVGLEMELESVEDINSFEMKKV